MFWSMIVHDQKSSLTNPSQNRLETVQSGPEAQYGEHAVSDAVKNMTKGKDKGKHLSPNKDYRDCYTLREPGFSPKAFSGYCTAATR